MPDQRPPRRPLPVHYPTIFVAALVGAAAGVAGEEPAQAVSSETPSGEQVGQAIDLAVDYIVRRTRQDGRFIYRINLNPEVAPGQGYNLLRHAGTMYALAQAYQRRPDPQILLALERAHKHLLEQIAPLPEHPEYLAAWSLPEETQTPDLVMAKLGGTGLALVALAHFDQIDPGRTPRETLDGLASFLQWMQRPDGSFYDRYLPDVGGKDPSWTSLYYPGEAALGLLCLYELDQNPAWLDTARRALLYLARSRQGEQQLPHDHWALIATGRLMEICQERLDPAERELLLQHARAVVQSILDAQIPPSRDAQRAGAFDARGTTAGCATRLEGLVAIRPWLDPALRTQVEASIHQGIAFLVRAQRPAGDRVPGAVPHALGPLPPDHPAFDPRFNRRATEVRIDYQQHFVSALIGYWQWQEGNQRGK